MFRVVIPDILTCPVAQDLAKKHNKTVAQILLRHLIQKGVAAIPKSSNAKRLRENIQIFDFVLDGDDVKRLDALDRGAEGRIFDMLHAKGWVLFDRKCHNRLLQFLGLMNIRNIHSNKRLLTTLNNNFCN